MKKILETDLYKPVHDYFKQLGYDVHSEVKDCDITATKGDELIIVELKRNLNLQLLIQAAKRQRITEYVYVAIPKPNYSIYSKRWKDICFIVTRLELGLMTVSFNNDYNRVNVIFDPSPFDRRKSMQRSGKKRKALASEIEGRHGNYNIGGSTRTKLMTAYKETSIFIACCLNRFNQLSPRKLRELGTGNKTQSILYNNYYGWFDKVERGIYKLSKSGYEALDEYPELTAYYNQVIDEKVEIGTIFPGSN